MVRIAISCLILFLVACSRNASETNIQVGLTPLQLLSKKIEVKELELQKSYQKLMQNESDSLPIQTIHQLEVLYKRYFIYDNKALLSAEYLDKLQQLYLQEKKYMLSLSWSDSLLTHFPTFKGKANVLLSAATTADVCMHDRSKMIYYYRRLLNEHPKLKLEIKKMVEDRLKYSELSYEDYLRR
jgi:hypothetical protein